MPSRPKPHALSTQLRQFYDSRAPSYNTEGAFHTDLAKDMIALAKLHCPPRATGNSIKVLDLCAGTGLATFAALDVYGPNVMIDAVDFSSVSIGIARAAVAEVWNECVCFHEGSVEALEDLELRTEKGKFDLIICCSAFVLLEGREATLRYWNEFLAPGGIIVFDVPVENTQVVSDLLSVSMEDVPVVDRSWIKNKTSIEDTIKNAGLEVVDVIQTRDYRTKEHYVNLSQIEAQECWLKAASMLYDLRGWDEGRKSAAAVRYAQLLRRHATNGVIVDRTILYIAVARRTAIA